MVDCLRAAVSFGRESKQGTAENALLLFSGIMAEEMPEEAAEAGAGEALMRTTGNETPRPPRRQFWKHRLFWDIVTSGLPMLSFLAAFLALASPLFGDGDEWYIWAGISILLFVLYRVSRRWVARLPE